MSGPWGIPHEEMATQMKEAYEAEGLSQCETCNEWKPTDEVNAHAGECQQCWEETP